MYTLISLILLLWIAGFISKIGGGLIHGLLLVAGVLFVLEMISGRRTVG
ncbi:MAG: lmo0937 family membrane protein [Candidatus Obscuribacterales bacterium]|nr:lmo0937 family membrane protein [Candidatus Obscuribacterales bacterium]